jgi:hypothetical protein
MRAERKETVQWTVLERSQLAGREGNRPPWDRTV